MNFVSNNGINKTNDQKAQLIWFGLFFLLAIVININRVHAQKIRTIEHAATVEDRLSTSRTQLLDTLDIQIKMTRLSFPEIHQLSNNIQSNIPQEYWVIISNPADDKKWFENSNIFLLYHQDFENNKSALMESNNWQDSTLESGLLNPLIDQFGQPFYRVFWIELFNHRMDKIELPTAGICAIYKDGIQRFVLTQDELSSDIDGKIVAASALNWNNISDINNMFHLKKKAIFDNLFTQEIVLPHSGAEGLIWFPQMKGNNEIRKIVLPKIKFYKVSQILFQSDVILTITN